MKTKKGGKFKSFLKKVVAVSLAAASLAAGRAVASSEQDYYNYLDKGKYSDTRLNYEDQGKYQHMDRSMHDNRNLLNHLDKGQYEHSDFYRQKIYEEHFRNTLAQTDIQDGRDLTQSEYFRNLLGYENPYNFDMNFYLGRELYGNKNIEEVPVSEINNSEYYKRKLLQDYGVKITESSVFEIPSTNRMVGNREKVDFDLIKRYYDLAKNRGSENIPRDVYWNIQRTKRGLNTPINNRAIGSNPIYGEIPMGIPRLRGPISYRSLRKTSKEPEKKKKK